MGTPAEPENELRVECSKIEQTFPLDSTEIEETISPKESSFHNEVHSPKESHDTKDHNFKEDINPKEEINQREETEEDNTKEDLINAEGLKIGEGFHFKEDPNPIEEHNPKEHLNSKEDQPNHTNRWSLQEHPNKGTPVRNSPSLGSIPKHKRASKCSKDELSDLPETWDEECQKHLVDFAER